MSKTIIVKLKKAGNRLTEFSVTDVMGNSLATGISKSQLIEGITLIVDDKVDSVMLWSKGVDCCEKSWLIPVTTIDSAGLAQIKFQEKDTASLWRHLTNPVIYNTFYGCIKPYIIEYPFAYEFQDEILQNVQDFTRAYNYLPTDDGVFNYNRKIEVNGYFNKAILYNGQQSSGVLELVPKPINNLKEYMSYPKYYIDRKAITYTKSDNFYQYNTFWSVVKDKTAPLFTTSCESLSIDKVVNQANMDYGTRSFKKEPLRAKFLLVRHILDNKSDLHLTSGFIVTPAQISYK